MIIAEKIKAVCKAQKTTFFALETKLGLGNGTIGKWGKNGRVPNYSNLAAVCSELGVSVEDIMRDDDVVPTSNKNAENAKSAPDPKTEGAKWDNDEDFKEAVALLKKMDKETLRVFVKAARGAVGERQR